MDAATETFETFFSTCGKALCWAQMLEQEILNSILLHAVARKAVLSRSEAETLLSRKGKQPLRAKLDEIFQRVRIEPDMRPLFFEAVEKRNYFVHQFFWDRYARWAVPNTRDPVIAEAREMEALFHDAYVWARGITELYAAQIGVTPEMISEELQRLIGHDSAS
jgi:hypothetical protein